MLKEVSDKVVIFLVVIAVLVSFLGTYLVYINTDNVPVGRTVIINNNIERSHDSGKVGVNVIPKENSQEINEEGT
ncbi:MAG TPA: hypothetical protein VJH20_05860 [Candidatus Nanoarchaeia archaeon]|nr:hypothetical protein [Candidatus Nanoarchaeia archaeon]